MSARIGLRELSLAVAITFAGLTACHGTQQDASDPADANLAPATDAQNTQQVATPQQAPAPAGTSYSEPDYTPSSYATDQDVSDAEEAVQASEPPPPLPEYSQPPCPGDDYIWTPGYWAWSDGYYWVPGAWVMAPWVGALWTPPWWGFSSGVYLWHAGFWGTYVGFYGGIDYGFGYTGRGYDGAYWRSGRVYYNRSVNNVNVTVVHNVYERPVQGRHDRVSYNGGRGGVDARPTAREEAARRYARTAAVPAQREHARAAAANRAQFVHGGNGRPAALAAPHPLATNYHAPAAQPPAAAQRGAERQAPPPQRAQTQPQQQERRGPAEARGNPQAPPQTRRGMERPQAPQQQSHMTPPRPAPPQNRMARQPQQRLEQRPAQQHARAPQQPQPRNRMAQEPHPPAREAQHPVARAYHPTPQAHSGVAERRTPPPVKHPAPRAEPPRPATPPARVAPEHGREQHDGHR